MHISQYKQPFKMSDNTLFLLKTSGIWGKVRETVKKGRRAVAKSETELMLKGYGLTTAELFYRMPDYLNVLNSFIWQDYDLAPEHPKLFRFIDFWRKEIEGPLHSVRFSHRRMISPGSWRNVTGEFILH